MASFYTAVTLLLQATAVMSQTIYPSNGTNDLIPAAESPRYLLNGTEIPDAPPVRLAPLGPYTGQSHQSFTSIDISGKLIKIDASNANNNFPTPPNNFFYISCDPEDYTGNMPASQVFTIAVQNSAVASVILYTKTSDHCMATGLDTLPEIAGIFTTTDTMVARMLAGMELLATTSGTVTLLPDLNSYTNSSGSGNGINNYSWSGRSPTTAVAMIILYSITGVITALFLTIIVTGAIRAHRHPERYGPRNIIGRGRQSRAKGIARAMLDTIPIVKFGDRNGEGGAGGAATTTSTAPKPPSMAGTQDGDIEMTAGTKDASSTEANSNKAISSSANGAQTTAITEVIPTPVCETPQPAPPTGNHAISSTTKDTPPNSASNEKASTSVAPTTPTSPPTTTSPPEDPETPSCSICTEDFHLGADMRVLPCNHKFHPECVDPWLLNVSGTCPLCRIDLRPAEPATPEAGTESAAVAMGEETRRSGSTSQDAYQPQAQHVNPYRLTRATAGFRVGEDLLMAGSLRSGRSRRMSSGGAVAAVPSTPGAGSGESASAFAGLRRALGGTREERVAALRRFRRENAAQSQPGGAAGVEGVGVGVEDEQHRSLATRLRDRLRVRTERRGAAATSETVVMEGQEQGGDGPTLGQIRSREFVGGRPL